MEGRHRHPAVTDAVRQSFIASYEKQYRSATKFADRFQSIPRPGGIEIMALDTTLPDTPLCRNLEMSKDGKWLSALFNWRKFWLPLNEVTKEEVLCLLLSSIVLAAKRLCIDISVGGHFYMVKFDGGIDLDTTVVETMKRADFLLGAFAFGREARSGTLFEPKEGQLPGYKNPILETARLLRDDAEYAAARCQYSELWLQPILVADSPITMPSAKWWDWWPELVFPKPILRLSWRLVLADLFGKRAYYDVPEAAEQVSAEAMVLLRPYQALMKSFQQHGSAWIASEPDLTKIEWYAKIFHVFSLARASSNRKSDVPPGLSRDKLPAMASSRMIYERADLVAPPPESNEVDYLSQALEAAFTDAIENASDRLARAAHYQQLEPKSNKLENTPEEQIARDGMRDCFAFILESIRMTSTTWVLHKDEDMYPTWWKPLHGLFGETLKNVDQVLAELHHASMEGAQARIAASLFVQVLLVELAQEMLANFEQLQDLDGILRVCHFMGGLYERMKDDDSIRDGAADGDVGAGRTRWSSIEQVSYHVNDRLFVKTNKTDPFNVLEMYLCGNNNEDETSIPPAKERRGKSIIMDHPLSGFTYGDSASNPALSPPIPDSKLAQAELIMDTYFIDGDIAASLACALVLVEDEEIARLSTHSDRARLWAKASMIAECAVAQRDLLSARMLVEGVEKALSTKTYKMGSMMDNKRAMLTYLNEACTLLTTHSHLFPRASTILLGRTLDTIAKVHQTWLDNNTASKWTAAAEACRETAKSKDDALGATSYACQWLLDAACSKKSDALKCTKGWHAMVATLL
ncbi:hypothetical protein BGW41_006480 [Actinomortierella wolfii]|nr:hypothetical protein BGW41_006480 [Actinomortierella wolfii]